MSYPAANDISTIPGEPATVRTGASNYTDTANAITDAARQLRNLASEVNAGGSDAVDALVEASDDVASRLDKLSGRYATAGSSLTTYADVLETAKSDASAAVDMRDTAVSDHSHNDYWLQHYTMEAHAAEDPADKEEAERWQRYYQRRVNEAADDLYSARVKYGNALETVKDAAKKASDAISEAIDNDGLNDSWWDKFKGWVSDHAGIIKAIKEVLGGIATVLGVLSFFFPPLAIVAAITAGVTALLGAALTMSGEQSWLDFGLDLLGVASFGVGRVASSVAKVAIAGRSARAANQVRNVRNVTGTMRAIKANRVRSAARGAWADGRSSAHMVYNESRAVQLPRNTIGEKLRWAGSVYGNRGIANARAVQMLKNGRVGAGGPVDDALTSMARTQIKIQNWAGGVGDAITLHNYVSPESLGNAVDHFAGDNSVLQGVGDGLHTVADWESRARAATTWRVGFH